MSETEPEWRKHTARVMGQTPWFAALGGEITGSDCGTVHAKVAWREDLVGDPDTGVVHGGLITSLLDQLCGAAVMARLDAPIPIATLDLRIDYMKPAPKGATIFAEARCLKITREIAFVRGIAHCGEAGDAVALCTAAFMLMRQGSAGDYTKER